MVLFRVGCWLSCLRKLPSSTSTALNTVGSKFTCMTRLPTGCCDWALSVRLSFSPCFTCAGPCHDRVTGVGGAGSCWPAGAPVRGGAVGRERTSGDADALVAATMLPTDLMFSSPSRVLDSVPVQYSWLLTSGRLALPTMWGVMDSTISVFDLSSLWLENNRPMMGIWPRPGTLLATLRF